MNNLSEENYWQLLELVASPDCEIDTDALAECLYKIAEGGTDVKSTAIESLIASVREFLPDYATNTED